MKKMLIVFFALFLFFLSGFITYVSATDFGTPPRSDEGPSATPEPPGTDDSGGSDDGGSGGGGGGGADSDLEPVNESYITSNVDYGSAECTTSTGAKGIDTVFGCVEAGPGSLPYYVSLVFAWVAGIIGLMAVAGLVYAGYTYTTSGGNPDLIAKAKDIIVTSISSVVIIIFSWALFKLLGVF